MHGEHPRPGRSPAEGSRRLRHLAARRRRPGKPRARGGGVPARPRARRRGGDHRRRRARAARRTRCAGSRGRCRPGVRHVQGARLVAARARARRRRLHDRHVRPLGARRAARADADRGQADRRSRRSSARARWGLWRGIARGVPDARGASRTRAAARSRATRTCARAAHVVMPSAYLRELAIGWGVPPRRASTVLPNPAPPLPELRPRDELRAELGLDGPTLAFAGRLTAQKSLDVGIEAARRAGVALLIAGDGPDRARARAARRTRAFSGRCRAQRRARAVPRRRRVAALVVVGELPAHRRRGARGRDAGDRDARRRRRRGRARRRERAARRARRRRRARRARSTASSPTPSSPRGCARTPRPRSPSTRPSASTGGSRRSCSSAARVKPRVLFVGRTRYRLPLDASLARKWDALVGAHGRARARERHRLRSALPARAAAPRSTGRASTPALPLRVARELRSFAPRRRDRREPVRGGRGRARAAARALARRSSWSRCTATGDVSTRLYGSPLRRAARARSATGSRRGRCGAPTAIAAVSEFTASLVRGRGREPAAVFTTYFDLGAFSGPAVPLPDEPRCALRRRARALQERRRARRGVAARRRRACPRRGCTSSATGTQVERRRGARRARACSGTAALEPPEVARALDASRALLLPSRVGGPAARRDRGVPARPRRRRRARRRDPGHRRGRGQRPAREPTATTAALAAAIERRRSPTSTSPARLGEGARGVGDAGSRRRRSTPTACARVVDAVLA